MTATALRLATSSTPQAALGNGRRPIFDGASATWLVKVFPGEYAIGKRRDEVLVTVLGSCVSACIRDRVLGIGGMNHFMLPQSETGMWSGDAQSMRFGNYAMEKLINELMKAGCRRENLEAKVFGGANVIQSSTLVGSANSEFVLRYLEQEGIPCVAQDLGGVLPRRIHYSAFDGRVIRRLLSNADNAAVANFETKYASKISAPAAGGDIELFE